MVLSTKLVIMGIGVAAAAFAGYIVYQQASRPPYALEVDATRDTTDISGTLYRIRVANVGTMPLTGIVAELGAGDVQGVEMLGPGQTYYFYPAPETQVSGAVRVTTSEGISVVQDYRSPTKVLGLPGGGR